MSVIDLVRADLRDFGGYGSARKTGLTGSVWLNANESPWASPADPGQGLNRYPEPQPAALRARLAALYGVPEGALLMTRGSDEGIDLLTRALCRAERDAVLVSPPVFGMYAVSARVQAAPVVSVPLVDDGDVFRFDVDAALRALELSVASAPVKLIYVCSPSNPTGSAVSNADLERLLRGVAGRALVVVDEAYGEYNAAPGALALRTLFPNLVVLRTLSKAYALAGARLGITIGDPALIRVLTAIAPPYPLASPAVALALEAVSPSAADEAQRRAGRIVAERDRVANTLRGLDGVRRVYASDANYVLVRFAEAEAAMRALLGAGVVVRDQRAAPGLSDALRITIGTAEENDAMLAALAALPSTATTEPRAERAALR
jgi:histidinol-phosphate aminotransferase